MYRARLIKVFCHRAEAVSCAPVRRWWGTSTWLSELGERIFLRENTRLEVFQKFFAILIPHWIEFGLEQKSFEIYWSCIISWNLLIRVFVLKFTWVRKYTKNKNIQRKVRVSFEWSSSETKWYSSNNKKLHKGCPSPISATVTVNSTLLRYLQPSANIILQVINYNYQILFLTRRTWWYFQGRFYLPL